MRQRKLYDACLTINVYKKKREKRLFIYHYLIKFIVINRRHFEHRFIIKIKNSFCHSSFF